MPEVAAPILLVPPLMVASEIYDMAADVSAVGALLRAGMDVWLVDFGAPERVEGGMDRTLDDHVAAVSDAIDRARAATGHDVHVAGYSQGGMFAYQAAAYRALKEGKWSAESAGKLSNDEFFAIIGIPEMTAGPDLLIRKRDGCHRWKPEEFGPDDVATVLVGAANAVEIFTSGDCDGFTHP